MVGDYAVNATGKFTQRLALGIEGSNYRPMAPNVPDDGRGVYHQPGCKLEVGCQFVDFESNLRHRGSGGAWGWSEGRGGVQPREESEGEERTECPLRVERTSSYVVQI